MNILFLITNEVLNTLLLNNFREKINIFREFEGETRPLFKGRKRFKLRMNITFLIANK